MSPKELLDDLRANVRIVGATIRNAASNLVSSRSVVDARDDAPVVSLTTFGRRTAFAFLAIESIGRGTVRPRRLILWLDEPEIPAGHLPRTIRRLQRRGLEVLFTEDLGPHKKYFPYVSSQASHRQALVTADDDVMYPANWLASLAEAHRTHPDLVIAHRARRVTISSGSIGPYDSWPLAEADQASFGNFATGMGGICYPPRFLDHLREAGDGFRTTAPWADDIWLHSQAVRAGYRVVRLSHVAPSELTPIRGARAGGLLDTNVDSGGNDRQIDSSYTAADIAMIEADRELGT